MFEIVVSPECCYKHCELNDFYINDKHTLLNDTVQYTDLIDAKD